jgi:hypothetical protein
MLGRLIVVAFFVGYLVEQSPHLVHHLFEPDEVQSDCSYLAAGDRHHLTPVDGPVLFSGPVLRRTVAPAVKARPITHDPGPTGARAPPTIS